MLKALRQWCYINNPVSWFEIHGRIKTSKIGVGANPGKKHNPNEPPQANEMQVQVGEAIKWCLANKVPIRLIEYKPRQKGCSTINTAVGYAQSRGRTMNGLVIGGQNSQTNNLWKMLRYYGQKDEHDWGNTWKSDTLKASCSNGSEWERETAGDKEAGRSGTYHFVLATEVARWRSEGEINAADVLNSVLNCVPDEPETFVIMESTANGPTGIFPETWEGAVTLDEMKAGITGNGYIKIFAPWYIFGDSRTPLPAGKDAEWLRGYLAKMTDKKALKVWDDHNLDPEQVYWFHRKLKAPECGGDPMKRDREYPTTEADGFKASSPSRFNLESIDQLDAYAKSRKNDTQYGSLQLAEEERKLPPERRNYRRVVWVPGPLQGAELAILEPPRVEMRYIISTDNMKGGSYVAGADPDCNAVHVIREGHYDARQRWVHPESVASLVPTGWGNKDIKSPGNRWDMDQLAELVARLSGYYGGCPVCPEANRGEHLIGELRKRNVSIWKRERPKDEVDSWEDSGLYGFETTPEMKKSLVETLAAALRDLNQPGAGIRVAWPWLLKQCRTFVRHKDGSEGAMKIANCHDDEVICLGIGWMVKAASREYAPYAPQSALPWDLREGAEGERSGVW